MYVPLKSLWRLNADFSASAYLKCPVKQVVHPTHAPPGISVTWALKPSSRNLWCPDSNRFQDNQRLQELWVTCLAVWCIRTHNRPSPYQLKVILRHGSHSPDRIPTQWKWSQPAKLLLKHHASCQHLWNICFWENIAFSPLLDDLSYLKENSLRQNWHCHNAKAFPPWAWWSWGTWQFDFPTIS